MSDMTLSHEAIRDLEKISRTKGKSSVVLAAMVDRLHQHKADVDRIKNPDRYYSTMRDALIPEAIRYADGQVDKASPVSKRQWDRIFLRRMTELAADNGLVSKEMLSL